MINAWRERNNKIVRSALKRCASNLLGFSAKTRSRQQKPSKIRISTPLVPAYWLTQQWIWNILGNPPLVSFISYQIKVYECPNGICKEWWGSSNLLFFDFGVKWIKLPYTGVHKKISCWPFAELAAFPFLVSVFCIYRVIYYQCEKLREYWNKHFFV